jgi:NAD(P)-dependent dehydrogenase (short-subunit alcohol dehydrogenase family)
VRAWNSELRCIRSRGVRGGVARGVVDAWGLVWRTRAGLMPQPVPTYAYDASKAAVHMLTRKFATEFADRRAAGGSSITVNAIAP